ncbi:hypothetical protein NFJ02_03g99850 [Pycnococcus provasolii]
MPVPHGGRGALVKKGGSSREKQRALEHTRRRIRKQEEVTHTTADVHHRSVFSRLRGVPAAALRSVRADALLAVCSIATVAALAALVGEPELLSLAARQLHALVRRVDIAAMPAELPAPLEAGLWLATAILLGFSLWLVFAATFDATGMVWGMPPGFLAAARVAARRALPPLCDEVAAHQLAASASLLRRALAAACSPHHGWQSPSLGMIALTTLACAALARVSAFALGWRVPGPDRPLAASAAAVAAALAGSAALRPELLFAFAGTPSASAALTDLEIGLWATVAILSGFFTWLAFASLFDVPGMARGAYAAAWVCIAVARGRLWDAVYARIGSGDEAGASQQLAGLVSAMPVGAVCTVAAAEIVRVFLASQRVFKERRQRVFVRPSAAAR